MFEVVAVMSLQIQDLWDVTVCQCGVIPNILKDDSAFMFRVVQSELSLLTTHITKQLSSSAYTFENTCSSACVNRN
jgi:hypothetical protein